MQVDMAELPEPFLDDASLFFAHGRGAFIVSVAFERAVDRRERGYRLAPFAQDCMDFIAVQAAPARLDDLGLDSLGFAPFAPCRSAPLRQQVLLAPGA